MKTLMLTCIAALICFCQLQAQTNNNYDSALAKKLQADDHGMKMYVLAILKKGTSTDTSKAARSAAFKGHMANINQLASENKLVVAGPFEENDKHYEGIFIFNTADLDEAKKLVSSDPAIQAKYLDFELLQWYCTAALQEIPGLHNKLMKEVF